MKINYASLPEKIPQRFQNLLGQKIGRLTVVEYSGKTKKGASTWKCLCTCGNVKILKTEVLNKGTSKSCGCLAIELLKIRSITHGLKNSVEYSIWNSMKSRCLNKKHKNYKDYGERGITICDEWINSFETFYADMGNRPDNSYSLERVNNSLGYTKENCIWTTAKSQCRNRRSNHLVTHKDKTQTIQAWSEEMGIRHDTLLWRLKNGWNVEAALTRKMIYKNDEKIDNCNHLCNH